MTRTCLRFRLGLLARATQAQLFEAFLEDPGVDVVGLGNVDHDPVRMLERLLQTVAGDEDRPAEVQRLSLRMEITVLAGQQQAVSPGFDAWGMQQHMTDRSRGQHTDFAVKG